MRRRRRRRRSKNMSNEKASTTPLPDVVVDEMLKSFEESKTAEAQELVEEVKAQREKDEPMVDEETQTDESSRDAEIKRLLLELKLKRVKDRQVVNENLKRVREVKEDEDESVYESLFGLVVQDCVDAILKKELMGLTFEMNRFRNNIAKGIGADPALMGKRLNMMGLPGAFEESWKVWRQSDLEDKEKKSFQTFLSKLLPEDCEE